MNTQIINSDYSVENYTPIREFIQTNGINQRLILTADKLQELSNLLLYHASLQINFDKQSPLSMMEKLVLAITVVTASYKERSYILALPKGTIRTYEKRAKQKLGVNSMLQAVCMVIQHNLVKIF